MVFILNIIFLLILYQTIKINIQTSKIFIVHKNGNITIKSIINYKVI